MKILVTETQLKNLVYENIPIGLSRRINNIKSMIPKVVKYYDIDEYSRNDFIDEVLHQIYDELDYDDVNTFFDVIKPMISDDIGKIYDRKVKIRLKRRTKK